MASKPVMAFDPLYRPPQVMDGSEFNQPKREPLPSIGSRPQPRQQVPQEDDTAFNKIMAEPELMSDEEAKFDALMGDGDNAPMAGESLIGNDKTAGFINGMTNASFVSSAITTAQSYAPADWETTVKWVDANGDISPDVMSMPEWLGIPDSDWDGMEPSDRRKLISKTHEARVANYWDADTSSVGYNVMNAVGMFVDPTTLMPVLGASIRAKAAFSAAVGGADMAMYQTAHKGAPTASGVGMGVALGGAIGGGIAKLASRRTTKATHETANAAGKKLAKYQEVLKQEMTRTDDPVAAMNAAHKKAGISFDEMAGVIRESRSEFTQHMPSDRVRDDWIKGWDKVFEPVAEHVKAMSPRVHKEWTAMERGIFETNNKYMLMVDEFLANPKAMSLDNLKRSKPQVFEQIKKAMLNNDRKSLAPLINEHMGSKAAKALEMYDIATKEAYQMMAKYRGGKNNPLAKELDLFTHRVVKDFDLFNDGLAKVKELNGISGKEHLEHIAKILKNEAKRLSTDTLSESQKATIYSNYFNGFYDTKKMIRTPSGAKHRFIKELPDEVMPAMHDPMEAMHTYFKAVTEDAHRAAFFGKNITAARGDDLTASIGDLVAQERKAGRLAEKDMQPLKDLLALRWNEAVKAPPTAFQWFKDLGYSALIGNPIAAIVQLGDIPLAAAQYGFRDTMGGLFDVIRKRGYTPEEAGLMNTLMEEMVSSGKTRLFGKALGDNWYNPSTKNILRRSLALDIPGLNKIPILGKDTQIAGRNINLTGMFSFKAIDRVGKATHMTASLRKGKRLVKSYKGLTELHAKWGEALGPDDFYKLVDDLKTGRLEADGSLPADIKTMIFSDLSEVQPVSLLQLPEAYWKHPKGRLLYMLRTFQLKYMNLVRQNMYYQLKQGNTKAAIKNGAMLMGMFTAGGASTTMLKQYMLGRDVHPKDVALDVFLKQTGFTDRYTVRQLSTAKDPLAPIMSNMLPPVNVFSPLAYTALHAHEGVEGIDTNGMVRRIPVMGGLYENYVMDGMEIANRKVRAEKRRR